MFKKLYHTPQQFDNIVMVSDGDVLVGLYFVGSKDSTKFSDECEVLNLKIFDETKKWLDEYFAGRVPNFVPKYVINYKSAFQRAVLGIVSKIPYGETITYGEIAKLIAKQTRREKMSAQAVGGAVGSNPICLILPCHRVLGAKAQVAGYGGGVNNKIELLKLEKIKFKNEIL